MISILLFCLLVLLDLGLSMDPRNHTGMRRLVKKSCDHLATIPLQSGVESLNISSAGAIFLYEVMRQRGVDRREEKGQ